MLIFQIILHQMTKGYCLCNLSH